METGNAMNERWIKDVESHYLNLKRRLQNCFWFSAGNVGMAELPNERMNM